MKNTLYLTPEKENIAVAAGVIKDGGLVCFPTETVYGLGANGLDSRAVADIFAAKGRPQDNPLILHLTDTSMLEGIAVDIPDEAFALFEKFAPGPLTLVLKRNKKTVPDCVSAGLDTVAVRIPSHPVAHALIEAAGVPIAAPSANISGKPSPTAFEHVKDELFGRVDIIIDGGRCDVGVESTVLSLTGERPMLLRPGGITKEQIEAVIGKIEVSTAVYKKFDGTAAAPGMKYRHYAPKAKVTVITGEDSAVIKAINLKSRKGAGVLCFDGEESAFVGFDAVIPYGREDEKESLARGLFDALRSFDKTEVDRIYARICDNEGVGLAVCNRLLKAAGFDCEQAGKKPIIIGLTGKSGTGKSTVLSLLKEKGVYTIEGDAVSKRLYTKNSPAYTELVAEFGDILSENGEIDRRALADKAFATADGTAALNKITHKYILSSIWEEIAASGSEIVAVEGAALIESGFWALCDIRLAILAGDTVHRIMARDGIDQSSATTRLKAQKSDEFYTAAATHVIKNDGDMQALSAAVSAFLEEVSA